MLTMNPTCGRQLGLALTVLLLSVPTLAHSQNPTESEVSFLGNTIRVDGPIGRDTADEFLSIIRNHEGVTEVSLNSPGGSVFPALDIARSINSLGIKTTVSLEDKCYSACSLIFLAGRERVASGLLGVHQISGVDDPSLTQLVIGQIYAELVKFNTPSYLISQMLRTPPERIYVFSSEELERHSINIRDFETQAGLVPHLLPLETWMHDDWLVGAFVNTHTSMSFFALESRETSPMLRIVHYPHRSHTFVEFIQSADEVTGTTSRIELRFGHGNDPSFSLFVDADIETNSYAFDLPQDPEQSGLFWAAFGAATDLSVFNGYGAEIGRYSLKGSRKAATDFMAMAGQ